MLLTYRLNLDSNSGRVWVWRSHSRPRLLRTSRTARSAGIWRRPSLCQTPTLSTPPSPSAPSRKKIFCPPPISRASEREREDAEDEGTLPPLPPLPPSASWLRVVRSAVRGAVWLGGGRPKTLYFDGEIEALANNATLQAQERVEVCLEALSAPHLPAAAGGCACVCVCSIYIYICIYIYIYIYMYIYLV